MNIQTDPYARLVVTTLGLTLAAMFAVALLVPKGDDVLLINGMHSEAADRFFTLITYGGDGRVFIPLLVVTLFIRFGYSLIAVSAWAGHGLLCSILKRLVFPGMLRPAATIDHDLLYFVPGVDVHNHFSFPSGHTATAFCLAVLVALVFRHRIVLLLSVGFAVAIAWSRVYLLQHFVIDVAAGALVGTGVAILSWHVFETYGRAAWLNKRLEVQIKTGNRSRVPAP